MLMPAIRAIKNSYQVKRRKLSSTAVTFNLQLDNLELTLPLALLMLRDFTDDKNLAKAFYDFTFLAHRFYRGSDFHKIVIKLKGESYQMPQLLLTCDLIT